MRSIEKRNKPTHRVVILIGSNIHPAKNLRKAIELLSARAVIIRRSRIWESDAVGSDGPDFLNQAVEIETDLTADEIKNEIIKEIETVLGRVRSEDKNAPRTIDLDIVIYNKTVLDKTLWEKAFIAVPVAEIRPDLKADDNQFTIEQMAAKLKSSTRVELFMDDN